MSKKIKPLVRDIRPHTNDHYRLGAGPGEYVFVRDGQSCREATHFYTREGAKAFVQSEEWSQFGATALLFGQYGKLDINTRSYEAGIRPVLRHLATH